MNFYLFLKYLHELAAIWFIAGIIGRQVVRSVMGRSLNIEEFASFSRLARRFERWMVIPGNFLVIVLGVFLAVVGGWPIFGFLQGARTNWLLATLLILLAEFLVVPLVYLPRGKVFDQALAASLAAGTRTPELEKVLNDRTIFWAHQAEYAGLLIIVGLMVLKPF